ncbi:MAG: hypothetical protein LBG80_09835 [Bacteroidales bacterium]|jgi:hypothetical protein|nr:hypothetical protein [Bacteroidales bacterium]
MARSIKEIADSIKEAFVKNTTLQVLYGLNSGKTYDEQFSDVSLETVLIEEVATASSVTENLVEMRKAEIDRIILSERYGYKGWYERMMKKFQFGDDVNELDEKDYYDTIDESKQIIKFAYCEEKEGGILLKVAKADANGEPEALDAGTNTNIEYTAVLEYINRVKPAGIKVELRSEDADKLKVSILIRYNALLFVTEDAMKNAVQTSIKDYLKSLEYNGAFVGMTMIDFLQSVAGIEIAQISYAGVSHALWGIEDITNKVSYTPYSGYLILDELSITTQ